VTKPDHVNNPVFPECATAFANDWDGGYQFMSVPTHDVGRAGVTPSLEYHFAKGHS